MKKSIKLKLDREDGGQSMPIQVLTCLASFADALASVVEDLHGPEAAEKAIKESRTTFGYNLEEGDPMEGEPPPRGFKGGAATVCYSVPLRDALHMAEWLALPRTAFPNWMTDDTILVVYTLEGKEGKAWMPLNHWLQTYGASEGDSPGEG